MTKREKTLDPSTFVGFDHNASACKKKRKAKHKRRSPSSSKSQTVPPALDSMLWSSTFPEDGALSMLVGSSEGGFMSLEELDECDFVSGSGVPETEKPAPSSNELEANASPKDKKKNKKKGRSSMKKEADNNTAQNDSGPPSEELCVPELREIQESPLFCSESKKRKSDATIGGNAKKKKKEKVKKIVKTGGDNVQIVESIEVLPDFTPEGNHMEDVIVNEDEFLPWKELRLHPLLMKSIYNLGFKEPTPIQKACIPASAHKGKDVIGAAETGSGKTLAFGLPILQRLLEEQEKTVHTNRIMSTEALRALIVAPTRELAIQVSDHLKAVAKYTGVQVVNIVGGVSSQKQERLLKKKPQIVVGTPGRLWELMSGGETHLIELESLSFFVLDEADRMIENGHFQELQSIIDMLPNISIQAVGDSTKVAQGSNVCETISRAQRKKRQTFVFSATVALSESFRRKLKRGSLRSKNGEVNSMETLVERTGMRADAAIIDLTNDSIMAHKLEESFIECKEEDKDSYLYYILSIHGHGRTIVFCTSCTALRRIASLLRILGLSLWTLHSQMQQRARLKAMDSFRGSEHGILIATDVAARGIDVPGVRTVVHYQLPHSAEVYIHRSGRTARGASDGCSIALISPRDRSKFSSLCKSFSKESLNPFPLDHSYMPEVVKRLSLASQIDKLLHTTAQEKSKKSWFERNAEALELEIDNSSSEEETVNNHRQKRSMNAHLNRLKQELNGLLSRPLQPATFSHRFVAGAGMSSLLQKQLRELSLKKQVDNKAVNPKALRRPKIVVIGRDCIEPLLELQKKKTS